MVENSAEDSGQIKSNIVSPYFDLAASIEVAKTIHTQGGGQCTSDQLVHWLGYTSIKSGTYVTRVSAASSKYFGLIDYSAKKYSVSSRGRKIIFPVNSGDELSAKVEAFLSVPLFKKVFEEFRGKPLPPESGLKNLFTRYGILPDRVRLSVRIFLNSAEQAGFFNTSRDRSRLIEPTVINSVASELSNVDDPVTEVVGSSAIKQESNRIATIQPSSSEINPAILGLLQKLPTDGVEWSKNEKARFLTAFTSFVDLFYPTNEDGA